MQIARNSSKEVWKIDDLLKLIKQVVEAREVCENVKANDLKSKAASSDHGRRNTPAALLAGWCNSKGQGIQCAYCRKSHYLASCEQLRSTPERISLNGTVAVSVAWGEDIEHRSVILPKENQR